ncbi:UDP-glycosyltransferase 78D2 [Striga hermonthica]|uniref:Glycosyltransferase n=1 Tax=Striga hermonthica TaxID=68872 RepID=A0A9N7N073_STRHE|nr:UDP-glycosyltransferase 78D2 [Striga hermonthica]
MMTKKENKPHVIVFAFPFGSHPSPMLHLMQRLAASAPAVDFSFFNTAESNRRFLAGADLDKYGNVKTYDIADGAPEGHVFSGNPLERVELFLRVTPGNFRGRLEEAVAERGSSATCLLTDAFLSFSADVAKDLGIPWVAFWTAGTAALSMHLHTDLIRHKFGGNVEERTLDFIPGLSTIHASDLPPEVLNPETAFSRLLHAMSLVLPRSATAVVLNSFDGVDPEVERHLIPNLCRLLHIGPFPLLLPTPPPNAADNDCLAWLARQAPASVAYISFGTMLTPPPPELLALAEALEERRFPYLWSFRDDSKREVVRPFFERMGSLGKVVRWAPQREVLGHPSVGAFVTHCGWNSVVEAVSGGVPMVCRPFFGDQMINRRRVEEVWRIGVGVEGGVFTRAGTLRALEAVLSGEMRDNIGRLKEKGMRAVAEGGTSSEDFKSLLEIITASSPLQE